MSSMHVKRNPPSLSVCLTIGLLRNPDDDDEGSEWRGRKEGSAQRMKGNVLKRGKEGRGEKGRPTENKSISPEETDLLELLRLHQFHHSAGLFRSRNDTFQFSQPSANAPDWDTLSLTDDFNSPYYV